MAEQSERSFKDKVVRSSKFVETSQTRHSRKDGSDDRSQEGVSSQRTSSKSSVRCADVGHDGLEDQVDSGEVKTGSDDGYDPVYRFSCGPA